ncbi:hypothetical protein ACH5RR_020607 [Cinchona calisaya]|uniref:Uncharacterized protein n=1 Tax=Cinchona calisaya TaxID=153742 RepID=A0ABD2ZG62_9GENT
MSNAVSQQISLFRSQIQNRRFGDETVAILESLLAHKDVKSSVENRSALKEFMKHESLSVIREIAQKPVDHKLVIADFLVRAFALIGDVESCLALRYEAFLMRDEKASSDARLEVSHREWFVFAEQSFDNGFYSIAGKACERALLCIQMNHMVDPENDDSLHCEHAVDKIKRLKDAAMMLASSQSGSGRVQVQASEYMKKKIKEQQLKQQDSFCIETHSSGSTMFRNGIKRRNLRKLQECQCLHQ